MLSPAYLKARFPSPEWAAAFAQDPQGLEHKLVPVMVEDCEAKGLLPQIVQIRIADKSEEEARQSLLQGVDRKRAKPSSPPSFPGAARETPKVFPGPSRTAGPSPAKRTAGIIPSLNRRPTDLDKRRFFKASFETIREHFEANLKQVEAEEPRIQTEFQSQTASEFRAELFLDGKIKCRCRIWQGGMHSADEISFSEGQTTFDNGCNEILTLPQSGELIFEAIFAMGAYPHERNFDLKRLSADDAASYLWQRFVHPLSY